MLNNFDDLSSASRNGRSPCLQHRSRYSVIVISVTLTQRFSQMQFHILNNEVDSSVQHLLRIWYLLRAYFRSSCHQIIIKRSFTVHTVRPQSNPFVMCKHICSTNYVYIMYLLFLKFEYMNSNITRILLFCEYFSALQAESNLSHIIVSLHIHYIQSFRPYTYKIFT